MKKLLLLLVTILAFNISNAQWQDGEYVDDFGELTGEVYKYQIVNGTFSNSATTNSICSYALKDDGTSFTISIYPYGRGTKERWIESVYQTMKIKTPSGEIKELRTFCSKGGAFYYSKKDYEQLMELLSEKGEFMFVMYYKNSYSESSYKFKFTN